MNPLWLSHFTSTSSIGRGIGPTLAAIREGRAGLTPCDFDGADLATFIGKVAGVDEVELPDRLADYDCRNNQLSLLGLMQDNFSEAVRAAIEKYGAHRIGLFLGTSTSGILQTELAYCRRDPVSGALPADFRYAATHNTFSAGTPAGTPGHPPPGKQELRDIHHQENRNSGTSTTRKRSGKSWKELGHP